MENTPLKMCRVCGLEALREEDLEKFVKIKCCLHGRLNLCKECRNLKLRSKREEERKAEGRKPHERRHKITEQERKKKVYEYQKRHNKSGHTPLCDCFDKSTPLTIADLMKKSGAGRGYVKTALARYCESGVVERMEDGTYRINPKSPLRFAMDGYYRSKIDTKK